MNLILLEPGEVRGACDVRLSGTRAAHLLNVLRVAPGHQVRVGILDGPGGVGTVQSVSDDEIELRCCFETTIPSRPRIDVLLALPRPKVLRRLWAQIRRAWSRPDHPDQRGARGAALLRHARPHVGVPPAAAGRRIAAGARHAGARSFPFTGDSKCWSRISWTTCSDAVFVWWPTLRHALPVAAVVRESVEERVLLAVGPEGGWNDFELHLLQAHGFQTAGLGSRTLRTDTACIALLALVHDAMRSRPLRI